MTPSSERIQRIRDLVQAAMNNYAAQTGNHVASGDDILQAIEDTLESDEDRALARYFAEDQILRSRPVRQH